jgi:hypothetical protein
LAFPDAAAQLPLLFDDDAVESRPSRASKSQHEAAEESWGSVHEKHWKVNNVKMKRRREKKQYVKHRRGVTGGKIRCLIGRFGPRASGTSDPGHGAALFPSKLTSFPDIDVNVANAASH